MKKIITTICLAFSLFSVLSLSTATVFADSHDKSLTETTFNVRDILDLENGIDKDGKTIENHPQSYFKGAESGKSPIIQLIITIIEVATKIIGSIAMIILIIGGFQLMYSQGEQQGLDSAKDTIKYAVIGLALAFLSYIIILFVQSIFLST